MSEYRRERRPCYVPDELQNMEPMIQDLMFSELSKNEKLVSCIVENIKESESLDSLTLSLQRFSLTYSSILNAVVSKIFKRWPRLRFLGKDAMVLFVLERAERYFSQFIGKALAYAQALGGKFGAESIGVTIGFPLAISITITLKINSQPSKSASNESFKQ